MPSSLHRTIQMIKINRKQRRNFYRFSVGKITNKTIIECDRRIRRVYDIYAIANLSAYVCNEKGDGKEHRTMMLRMMLTKLDYSQVVIVLLSPFYLKFSPTHVPSANFNKKILKLCADSIENLICNTF